MPSAARSTLLQGAHHRRTRIPKHHTSTDDTDAMVAWVGPAILELLADGMPRSKRAIVAKLAGRHPEDEVVRTLIRLAVTGQVGEAGGKYVPAPMEADPA